MVVLLFDYFLWRWRGSRPRLAPSKLTFYIYSLFIFLKIMA